MEDQTKPAVPVRAANEPAQAPTAVTSIADTPSAPEKKSLFSQHEITLILALAALCLSLWQVRTKELATPAAQVMVIDDDRLSAAMLQQALKQVADGGEGGVAAVNARAVALQARIQALADSGAILVRKSTTVAFAANTEITEQLAQDVGLVLPPAKANMSVVPVERMSTQPGLPAGAPSATGPITGPATPQPPTAGSRADLD